MKGLWLAELFLQMLASHYTQLQGAIKVTTFSKMLHPMGTVGLCAALVSHFTLYS